VVSGRGQAVFELSKVKIGKHRLHLTLFCALTLAPLCLGFLASCVSTGYRRAYGGVYHQVIRGQNLYRISLAYGVPLEVIARANNISDPHSIKAGSYLFIPGAKRTLEVPIVRTTSAKLAALPVAGVITSPFGPRSGGSYHTGLDISAPWGTKITVVLDGTVVFSGKQRNYGNVVKIKHADGLLTIYAHNEKNLVRVGQRVKRGDVIATVGRSGKATGCHVHFEVRRHGRLINPLDLLEP
jgi:LysM repeat protein